MYVLLFSLAHDLHDITIEVVLEFFMTNAFIKNLCEHLPKWCQLPIGDKVFDSYTRWVQSRGATVAVWLMTRNNNKAFIVNLGGCWYESFSSIKIYCHRSPQLTIIRFILSLFLIGGLTSIWCTCPTISINSPSLYS